jgi:hypothetical protein
VDAREPALFNDGVVFGALGPFCLLLGGLRDRGSSEECRRERDSLFVEGERLEGMFDV